MIFKDFRDLASEMSRGVGIVVVISLTSRRRICFEHDIPAAPTKVFLGEPKRLRFLPPNGAYRIFWLWLSCLWDSENLPKTMENQRTWGNRQFPDKADARGSIWPKFKHSSHEVFNTKLEFSSELSNGERKLTFFGPYHTPDPHLPFGSNWPNKYRSDYVRPALASGVYETPRGTRSRRDGYR